MYVVFTYNRSNASKCNIRSLAVTAVGENVLIVFTTVVSMVEGTIEACVLVTVL